mmetsp:Transcript_77500/g.155328  ORF Transcript_77500/g.155328 Transcript_77500/m.155328 type:complete len:102 (-) Transcript_77500:4257-4562(-)
MPHGPVFSLQILGENNPQQWLLCQMGLNKPKFKSEIREQPSLYPASTSSSFASPALCFFSFFFGSGLSARCKPPSLAFDCAVSGFLVATGVATVLFLFTLR